MEFGPGYAPQQPRRIDCAAVGVNVYQATQILEIPGHRHPGEAEVSALSPWKLWFR